MLVVLVLVSVFLHRMCRTMDDLCVNDVQICAR